MGDSCYISIQKRSEYFIKANVFGNNLNEARYTFNNLENGAWIVKIFLSGYYYPPSKAVYLKEQTTVVEFEVSKILDVDTFVYSWEDDSSYLGHPRVSNINKPTSIVILNDTIIIPASFSAIQLKADYGIILSNELEEWTEEDAFRLYSTIKRLPYNDFQGWGDIGVHELNSVWTLTRSELFKDLEIEDFGDIKKIRISASAFTYALPFVAEVDGIRGKFFSKRLFQAVLNYYTNFASDKDVVDFIRLDRTWRLA